MLSNGAVKNSSRIKFVQKAVLMAIGATLSKDTIKKAASTLFNDLQKELHKLLNSLEYKGEVKAKETKHIIKEIQKSLSKKKRKFITN